MIEAVVVIGTIHTHNPHDTFETHFPTFPHVGMLFADDDGEVYKINRVIVHAFKNPDESKDTAMATLEVQYVNENIA